ncbi:tetratricopeptide repeat-containing sensor histidine kinase [Flavobacterium sp. XGLA_31]|uniref:tetratricopeptide repeat-containing sensor histidine kinase n=1 Tax=Flavobacterium sp. XGLA_31 TaxID=3447666 RepID=UPI003F3C314F
MKRKTILTLLIISLFFGCSKRKLDTVSEKTASDSLNYYMGVLNSKRALNSDKTKAISSALKIVESLKNTSRNRDTLFSIVYILYNNQDWNSFNSASQYLLKQSIKANDSINMAKSYRFKANYFKRIQSYDSSFIYYRKAEKIYYKKKDKINYANILFNKGIVQSSVGDFLGAELSLSKAYYIFKDSNEKDKLYGTLNQLGLVYTELKEYDKAILFHNKALDVVKNIKSWNREHPVAICYNNIGYLYLRQKKFNEAIVNFELGLKDNLLAEDDPDTYGCLLDNLAYSRLKSNNYKDLPKLFYDALEIRNKLDDYTYIVGSNIHISEYYQKIGNNKLALEYSEKALKIAKESKIPVNLVFALKQASIVDKAKSIYYSEQYIKINDSLQIEERKSKDRFNKIQFETDEIKQENVGLAERNRNLLYAFIITFIIVALLFVVRAQRARTRELLYKQAQQKANEDIYNLMMSQQAIIDESRSKEKKRLAQDLHDGVLGRMFGLRLNLDSLNSNTDEESVKKRTELLNELKTIEQDIREISHDLNREKQVLINNFVSIVHNLLEEQKNAHEANVTYYIDNDVVWDKVANAIKINMYRILQEGLQNINKYANAKNIIVEVKGDKENVYLKIQDDGVGFDVNRKSKGIGMQNMISRTSDCNGIIDISSKKNEGTKIVITLPIETKQLITEEQ